MKQKLNRRNFPKNLFRIKFFEIQQKVGIYAEDDWQFIFPNSNILPF